jgi:hypothetical protein
MWIHEIDNNQHRTSQMVELNKVACVQFIEISDIIISQAYNGILFIVYAIIRCQ